MKQYYKKIDLKSWTEFKGIVENSNLEWIFRGQSNSEWDLSTTLERSKIIDNFPDYEDQLLHDFKAGVKFYSEKDDLPVTTLEHFSMLQHFGAPSRLLDFTKSPYIAAYFAFEEIKNQTENIAIWVVNKSHLYQRAIYYFQKLDINYINGRRNSTFNDRNFEDAFIESKKVDFDCIFPVEPKSRNQRYHLQQSIFIAQGNPGKRLADQLDFINKDILMETFMKITIPASEQKKALRDLMKMNISRASLFPGLDGFAKSLFIKYSNLTSIREMSEYLSYTKRKNMS